MNASKENARKAIDDVGLVVEALNTSDVLENSHEGSKERDVMLDRLHRVQNFLKAAERKLPTKAAYEKRRKVVK